MKRPEKEVPEPYWRTAFTAFIVGFLTAAALILTIWTFEALR